MYSETRLKQLEHKMNNIIRIGKVVEINAAKCKARVEFEDRGKLLSREMALIMPHTQSDKFYSMPVIDEYVLCAFLTNGGDTGFIIGSYYSDKAETPVADENKFHVTFDDGTKLEYDKAEHKLTADVKGSCYIKTEKEIDVKTDDTLTVNAAKEIDIKTDDELKITAAKDITIKTDADISVKCINAKVEAATVTVDSPDVKLGKGALSGVVTQMCVCSLTGCPHPDASTIVKGAK